MNSQRSNNVKRIFSNAALGICVIFTLAVSSVESLAQTCSPAPVGLASWYAADGNALDSRSRNNGTIQGNVTFAAGNVGQTFNLGGTGDLGGNGDRVNVGNPTNLQLQDFTIESWIKRSSSTIVTNSPFAGVPFGTFFAYGQNGYAFLISQTTNQLALSLVGTSAVFSTSTITDTNWHHVAVTKTGNQVTFYVDGVANAPVAYNVTFTFTTNAAIGARGDNNVQNAFFGSVDEFAIHNRALSASEIQSIFNAGTAGKCKPTATVAPGGQVAWFGGDGNPNDISGNGNNGTLQNGAGFAVSKVGQGFTFDGVNDFVRIPISPSLQTISNAITIDLWAKLNSFNSPASLLLSNHIQHVGSPVSGVVLWVNPNGTVQFQTRLNNVCCQSVTSNAVLQTGIWQHITGVWDGANLRLYLDGNLDNTVPASGTLQMNRDIFLGINADDFFGGTITHQLNGLIDEVSLYNRALTQAEITSIVNAGIAGKLKTVTTPIGFAALGSIFSAFNTDFASFDENKTFTPASPEVVNTTVGDATVTFPTVTTAGTTQEIPLDLSLFPPLPIGTSSGLAYDIATSAAFTGNPTVCFNVPSFTPAQFAGLRILHFENGAWVNRTAATNTYPTLCTSGLTSLSPFAITTPKSRADFDGDGRTDISVFRPSEGNWYLNRSTAGFGVIKWGISTDTLVPGDYDGDGNADTAVFRPVADPAQPDFFILNSNGFTVRGASWGLPSDVPISGDYDGDGKTDVAVFRPSSGTWFILNSTGAPANTIAPFGQAGDVPMAFDLENDGKTNLAVYRPGAPGSWFIARNTGTPATNFETFPFGTTGDLLVPADYDGDNKDDAAVFRPSNGTWYIRRSSDGATDFRPFGTAGDVPVPGDYDGDGSDDIAVYRGGTWFVNRSTSGLLIQSFGLGSDRAIPKSYIP